jgi:hypothetical protein
MNDEHTRVIELLPWFVNGTLPTDEHSIVETHVSQCLPCRRALKEERSMLASVRGREAPTVESKGLEALLHTIDCQQAPRRTGPLRPRFTRLYERPRALAAAASVAILAVGMWLGYESLLPTTDVADAFAPQFSTLAYPGSSSAERLDVIFAAQPSEAELGMFLDSYRAVLAAGPSDIGRFTLAFPDLDAPEMARVLAELHADARVRFAGPSFIPKNVE